MAHPRKLLTTSNILRNYSQMKMSLQDNETWTASSKWNGMTGAEVHGKVESQNDEGGNANCEIKRSA